MKHPIRILAFLACGVLSSFSQNIDTLPSITGSGVDKDNDFLMLRDASAADPALRKLPIGQIVNVPGMFSNASGNSAVNAAIGANPESTRKAVNSHVGFYEDFSRHADGLMTSMSLSPQTGSTWGIAGGTDFNGDGDTLDSGEGSGRVIIANGGVNAAINSNFYLGSTISCPDGVLDVSFEIEQRQGSITLTGATPSAANASLVPAWVINGRFAWSKTGIVDTTGGNVTAVYTADSGGTWTITYYSSNNVIGYQCVKTGSSVFSDPVGITGWTIVTGSGQMTAARAFSRQGGGFTFSYKASPNFGNPGGNADNTVHINFDSSGPVVARYVPTGSPTVTLKSVSGAPTGSMQVAPGVIKRIRVWASGTRLIIFYPGVFWEYEVSDGADMIGTTTYFYFQSNRIVWAGLDAPSVRGFTSLRRMWANAPFYDQARAETSSPITMGADAVHPGFLDIRPANHPLAQVIARNTIGAPLAVGGTTVDSSGFVSGSSIFADGKIWCGIGMSNTWGPGIVPVWHQDVALSSPLASPANAVITTSFRGLVTLHNAAAGSATIYHFSGLFGANGNEKEILIRNNYGGWVTQFTTGTITQNGGPWTLEVRRLVHTGANRTMIFQFWSPSTGTIGGHYAYDRLQTLWDPLHLCVRGTAAGDVTLLESNGVSYLK